MSRFEFRDTYGGALPLARQPSREGSNPTLLYLPILPITILPTFPFCYLNLAIQTRENTENEYKINFKIS